MNKHKSPMSQEQLVLKHLREVGHITNMEANMVHGIRSVSRRISELQKMGHAVNKATCYDINGQRYTKYTLAPAALTPYMPAVGDNVIIAGRLPPDEDTAGNHVYKVGEVGRVTYVEPLDNTSRVRFRTTGKEWWVNNADLARA